MGLASGGVLVGFWWDFGGFGMVFAGDISDVMFDREEQRRFEACEHKHTTSRFRIHLAKAELAVPFFYTDIYYIIYNFTEKHPFWHFSTPNGIIKSLFSHFFGHIIK